MFSALVMKKIRGGQKQVKVVRERITRCRNWHRFWEEGGQVGDTTLTSDIFLPKKSLKANFDPIGRGSPGFNWGKHRNSRMQHHDSSSRRPSVVSSIHSWFTLCWVHNIYCQLERLSKNIISGISLCNSQKSSSLWDSAICYLVSSLRMHDLHLPHRDAQSNNKWQTTNFDRLRWSDVVHPSSPVHLASTRETVYTLRVPRSYLVFNCT